MVGTWYTRTARDDSRARRRFAFLATAALLALGACSDDIIPDPEGRRIRGRVFYDGDAHAAYARPTLQVAAFGAFPPIAAPHSLVSIIHPPFAPDGVDYELRELPAFGGYYVLAQIVDLDDPDTTGGPTGAYPDFCQLSAPQGNVAVSDDTPAANIDITLYDSGGAEDPCADVSDACPSAPGNAAMILDVSSMVDPASFTDDDTAVVALFRSFPGAPTLFRLLPRSALEFPLQVIVNDIEPGDYIVYVCYDRFGDDSMGLCEEGEDVFAFYTEMAPVPFAADTITSLALDIDTGASGEPEVLSADEAGCSD